MKRKLLLFLSFFVTMTMMAGPVTKDEAAQKAQAFINGKNKQRPGGPRRVKLAHRQMKLVQAAQENALYYVFNVGEEDGFVIVSGDDRTPAVLGYTDSGSFSTDQMPDNMRAWLQGYADQIAWLQEHPEVENEVFLAGTSVKQPIEPLVATVWNQDSPYNDLAPYYGVSNGSYVYSVTEEVGYKKCATGCVATAMAQVMKYNRWPEQGTSAIPSYKWKNANINLSGLSSTTFDWGNMIDDYRVSYSTSQGTAVATLMQYCGYSVQMDYGKESGANTSAVADALKNYFDYASTTTYKDRSLYTYSDWIELLYNELTQGRPMVYSGQSSGGGHAFVCDGYEGEDYFHINWGWGSMSDGYFKLSAMNPYAQGIGGSSSKDGFTFGQGAVVGIQKNGGTGTVLDITQSNFSLSLQSITLSSNSVSLGETVDVTFRITNNGPDDYSGDVWVCVPINGNNVLQAGNAFYISAGETKDCVIHYTPEKYIGTFSIMAYRPTGGGWYSQIGTQSKSLTVTQGSGNPTSSSIVLGSSIEVENSELISGIDHNVYGTSFKGVVTLTNPEANTDFYGQFQCDLYDQNMNRKAIFIDRITVPANGSFSFPLEFNGLESGKKYYVYSYYAYANWNNFANYTVKPGIVTYTADGSLSVEKVTSSNYSVPSGVLAVDLTTTTDITSITSNDEPNCLVLISSGATKPSGANNVVVKNGSNYTAETITLTDNNGFYSPVDFTAAKVEFNYDFTVAADGTNGWNTLVLPFKAGKVTADDAEIDWFRSSTDKGKNFWLKSFASDESTQVYFDFVEEIQANTPYIVAFPGNRWGRKWDMSNKTIKFIGENVEVSRGGAITSTTGSYYRFVGNTVQDNTANIYSLNEDGNLFVLNASAGSAPFRAFFKPGIFDASVTSLSLGSVTGGTTSIGDLPSIIDFESDVWYSIDGRRLSGKPTQKGVYIMNGKKTIIK